MSKVTGLKRLGYAYPSSDLARQLGFGLSGCWYLDSFYIGCAECDIVRIGFPSLIRALDAFGSAGGQVASDCMTHAPTWASIMANMEMHKVCA